MRPETTLAATLLVAALTAAPASPTELNRIQALADRDGAAEALRQLEDHLVGRPERLDGQLLRGALLAELGRSGEAERLFRQLQSQYPGQPEPTHNLAVMQARAFKPATAIKALEEIVGRFPTYETAASNLARIRDGASRGNFDPLTADSSRLELALTPRLRFPAATAGSPTPETEAPALAALKPIGSPAAEPPPSPPPMPAPAAEVPPAEPPAELPATAATTGAASGEPSAEEETTAQMAEAPAAPPADELRAELEAVVTAWASAWSQQRVKEYLGFYASEFQPSDHPSRAAWEAVRRQRVAAPSFIEVEIDLDSMTVERTGPDAASATFGQSYRSDRYSDSVTKSLGFVRESGAWRIRSEVSQ